MKYISKENIRKAKSLAGKDLIKHVSYVQPFWISEPYLVDSEEGKAIDLLYTERAALLSEKKLSNAQHWYMLSIAKATISEIYIYALTYKDTERIWSSYGEEFTLYATAKGWYFYVKEASNSKAYIHLVMGI